ncbi:class I SAM-dependent methyltransferase [Pseudonocardia nematodicida]|uniref:Class I SAM-dependent methyltransferase n=1 Tax=Pseudonocardia nematodicida TaxID=1206997 RepID=A0ABV1KDB5_9PSEU
MTSTPPEHDDPVDFWEAVYAGRDRGAEPRVNARLAEIAADLPPGDALDLGCGPGGDALWLARHGWRVTAVDISATATGRLTALAAGLGLADRVRAERHDLAETFPDGRFDLVSAQYLQTPFDLPRDRVLTTAARALRPGGRLIVVDHGSVAPWSWFQDRDVHFPTPQEIRDGLDLGPDGWTVERAETPRRTATGPGGQTAEVVDHVLVLRRDP